MKLSRLLGGLAAALLLSAAQAAPSCLNVAADINRQAGGKLDSAELSDMLLSLNAKGRLPDRFVTKRQARDAGWQPGRRLWDTPALKGKSIGGDRFGNYEKQLPAGQWQEADLNYKGGKRGAYRMAYSRAGQRFVSADHYRHFIEVPSCQ